MASLRSFSWFLSIPIVLGGMAVQPAAAKPRDMSLYPLRVRILESDVVHRSGRADLIDGQDVHGFDFSFSCTIRYMISIGNQAYAAKWNKPGKTLEVVSNPIGDEKHTDVCEFKVTLYDYVYFNQNGILTTLTQQQYKVEIGALQPATGPMDGDLSHYPLRVSVLEIAWGPPANSQRLGTGRGNVAASASLSSVDFTANCSIPFHATGPGRFFPGRWLHEGTVLSLLLRVAGAPDGSNLCILKTSLHTDVYILDASGAVKALTAEEYRSTILKATAPAVPGAPDAGKSGGETAVPAAGAQADLNTPGKTADQTAGVGGGGMAVQKVGSPDVVDVQTTLRATNGGLPSPDKTETTVVVTAPNMGISASTSSASAQAAALYRKACDGGSPLGCRNLAILYSVGNGVSQSFTQAATLYRKACNGGDVGSCTNLGLLYANGNGVSQDYGQAVTLYRSACDAGDKNGCSNLGLMYTEGRGVPRDYSHAVTLFRATCDAGLITSCSNLGLMYATGTGVLRDYAQAVTLYSKACDAGFTFSCSNLGLMYANGTGVPRDDTQAVALYRKACDAGDLTGCGNLGEMYANGTGVPQDYARAATLARKACDAGVAVYCGNLGLFYANGTGVLRDYAQAMMLYRKACDAGIGGPCVNLGNMYESGTGVSRGHAQALSFFRKACDGGTALGCNNLGVMVQKESDSAGPRQ